MYIATVKTATEDQARALKIACAWHLSNSGLGKQIREAAKVSQPVISEGVGVTVASVSRWENGLRAPRGDAAVRWVDLLVAMAALHDPEAAADVLDAFTVLTDAARNGATA